MTISNEIINVFDYLGEKFGIAIDWTNVNVLPYVQQLCEKFIKWEIGTSIGWIVIMVLFVIIGLIFSKLVDWEGLETAIFFCIVIAAIIIIAIQTFNIITCYTFPEKAIYDYLRRNGII